MESGAAIRVLEVINANHLAWEFLRFRVLQALRTGRHDCVILCSGGPYVERLREAGCEVIVVDTPRSLAPLRLIRAIGGTARVLRAGGFDVIHTHAQVVGLVGRVAAWMAGTPVVIHQVHAFHHHPWMPRWKRWVFVTAERLLARLTDLLVFQSPSDLEECQRRKIAPPQRCRLVGNGIQLDRFRADLPSAAGSPVLLYVARFEATKDHDVLLRAARLLDQRGLDFVVELVGDGPLRPRVEQRAAELGIASRVRFLGYREDIPALTAAATLCVRPSLKEGLPRGLMEAAACGRPAVATDVGGNRDVIVHGLTGFLVPPRDPEALAGRMAELLRDPALRRRMGEAAAARARELFDERVATARILALYDEAVLAGGGATRKRRGG